MHQLLFKNRFNALVFVAIILFSVRLLIGTDDERGALETAADQFESEPQADQSTRRSNPATRPASTGFTPEEELIDETEGLEPSGWSSDPGFDQGQSLETAEVQPDGMEG